MNCKIRRHRVKFSKLGFLYTISITIIAIHQAGLFSVYYLTPFFIGSFWFCLGLLARNTGRHNYIQKDTDKLVSLFTFPWVVFILYNVFLFITGNGYMEFLKSSFVQIMFVPCILLGTWGAYNLFGKNTLRYIFYAIFIQYIFVLSVLFLKMGPSSFFSGIMSIFAGNSIGNPFEINSDVVLSLGILLIYLSDRFVKKSDLKNGNFWLIALVFFLGGKKICLLSIVCIIVYMIIARPITDKKRIYFQNVISCVYVLGYFMFIYLVASGILSTYVWTHGINTMGRINMWNYIAKFISLKVSFLGNGYVFCNLILQRDRVYTFEGHVYALHSDALKMYAEFGFLVFLFWIIYNLFIMTNSIRKRYSYKVSNVYWAITAYMFILYLTDNPINYYITQTIYIVVILDMIRISKHLITKPKQ